jgi:hypothetical protein
MDGDTLLTFLGKDSDASEVQEALIVLARGMRPELDPLDEENYVDWVTVNEIGLEFGFLDEAFLKAKEEELRRNGPLVLSQLYFYGETPKTHLFPYALPLGLTFDDDRQQVRFKLAAQEDSRRSYIRDAWTFPQFGLTVAYREDTNRLESVFAYLPLEPWPTVVAPDEVDFPAARFVELFGLRWSDRRLHEALMVFELDRNIAEVRSIHEADLRFTHGVEFMFTEGAKLRRPDVVHPYSLAFGAVTYYAARETDAVEWPGPLPFGLTFSDSQPEILRKVGAAPYSHEENQLERNLTGQAMWHFSDFDLAVKYSNIENRILRVTIMDPGYPPQ